jgi:hypothetical protein
VDFCHCGHGMAKQMMETTKDAAVNAKEVLGYGLPASFDRVDVDARYGHVGHFYQVASGCEEYNAYLSMPDPAFPTAFQDATGSAIGRRREKGSCASLHDA